MQKQKKTHYKIMLTALGLSILIINSCRKMELSVSTDLMATEKFFTLSANINPSVKKVVDKLKSINNKKEFVSSFADKEGFAIWDKAMVTITNHKKSGRFSTSRNSSDSANGYDTTITIPVVLNSTVYVNAAIVATLNDSISLSLFRGRDYSNLPYGNHGVDTFTAEKYAVQFMKLEKRVFGTNSFLLTDHNLFSYLLNTNNGRSSLLINPGPFDITMGSGECVDMINLLYNNPDMILSNGTVHCIGFEQGGGPIDTHMPPIINTGGGSSTGGSGGSPVGGGGNNNGSGNGGSNTGGVRPPSGLGWTSVDELPIEIIPDPNILGNFIDDPNIFEEDPMQVTFDYNQAPWPAISNVLLPFQFVPYDHRNCLALAQAQIAKAGLRDLGYGSAFKVYDANGGPYPSVAKSGINYIITKLQSGKPVIVGVDNRPGTPSSVNADGKTDHFITIVGSGQDSQGKYFSFYDNASNLISKGCSSNNKLYYDENTGIISGYSAANGAPPAYHDYFVTQIRKNQ